VVAVVAAPVVAVVVAVAVVVVVVAVAVVAAEADRWSGYFFVTFLLPVRYSGMNEPSLPRYLITNQNRD
jgi:tryptophan-rich sensory protein